MENVVELYRKLRPTDFAGVFGQPEAVKMLQKMVKSKTVSHAIMFCGPSGTGKTTMARILKGHLNCADNDFYEMNCADLTGINNVRQIIENMRYKPRSGGSRIWLIDEAHGLSPEAQDAFLKPLEDPPGHAYVFFCTTRPEKMRNTLSGRCKIIELKALDKRSLDSVVSSVLKSEGKSLDTEVFDRITETCEGSARDAINKLEQCLLLKDKEEQLNFLFKEQKNQAKDLVYLLVYKNPKWPEVAKLIKNIDVPKHEMERFRHFVLTWANTELLKGKQPARAYLVTVAFGSHWFDCPESGLASSCWAVLSSSEG